MTKILLVEPDAGQSSILCQWLSADPAAVPLIKGVETVEQAFACLAGGEAFDVVLYDAERDPGDWRAAIHGLSAEACGAAVVALLGSEEAAGQAMAAGAQDYVGKPGLTATLLRRVVRYAQDRARSRRDIDRLEWQTQERRRMETALHESQARIQAITESLFEGVLVVDGDGFVAFSNRSADTLLGDGRFSRIAGRSIDQVFSLCRGDGLLRFADSPFRRVIETGQPFRDDDALLQLPSGRSLVVAYACSAFVEEELCKGIILSFRDIRSLKKAQQDALQASKLASVGQLAAGIAHEINTPIQYIGDNLRFLGDAFDAILRVIGYCRRLAGDPSADGGLRGDLAGLLANSDADFLLDEIPQAVVQSLEGVGQVARIVLALKEFSHPGERDKTPVDLNRAIQNALTVCHNEWKNVADLHLDLATDLPLVPCLPGEMNQVLLNILINAIHAIEATGRPGKGVISVATKRRGRMVDIVVQDNGVGMSDQVKERIFDPFFTTKAIGKGTGQGLAICRDVVVTKHGGRISVETKLGNGSTFVVTLPIDEPPAGA